MSQLCIISAAQDHNFLVGLRYDRVEANQQTSSSAAEHPVYISADCLCGKKHHVICILQVLAGSETVENLYHCKS